MIDSEKALGEAEAGKIPYISKLFSVRMFVILFIKLIEVLVRQTVVLFKCIPIFCHLNSI